MTEGRAHATAAEPFTLAYAEAFDITSAAGADYRVSVGFPRSYAETDRRYPVLYVFDGVTMFCTALELSRTRGETSQEIVVVGIAYPLDTDLRRWGERRLYDFTTENWDFDSPTGRLAAGVHGALGQAVSIGGLPAMVDFVTRDLQPVINERYRVDPDDQGVFGHSGAGNFVTHLLFRTPERFDKFIIGSPGFGYNDWEIFRLEDEYAQSHDDLAATVYLGAGIEERTQFANFNLVSGTARMAETLHNRGYPGLSLTCEILPGKDHSSAVTEFLHRGLETCWPATRTDWGVDYAERMARERDLTRPWGAAAKT